MRRDEGLAAAVFAIVMGGAVAFTIANDITAPACRAARATVQSAKDFDFGCLEFWLNRYQGLIGSILTGAAAAAAVYWAARQLTAATRQAATAAASALRLRVQDLEDELKAVELLSSTSTAASALLRDAAYFRDIETRRRLKANSTNIWDEFCSCRDKLRGWNRANKSDPAIGHREAYVSAIDEIGIVIAQANARFRAISEFNSPSENEVIYFRKLEAAAKERFPWFFARSSEMQEKLAAEIAATWRQVREFERSAVAE